jgi:hypothetical protein
LAERLADGRAADAELLGKRRLAEPGAGRQVAAQDPGPERRGEPVDQFAAIDD